MLIGTFLFSRLTSPAATSNMIDFLATDCWRPQGDADRRERDCVYDCERLGNVVPGQVIGNFASAVHGCAYARAILQHDNSDRGHDYFFRRAVAGGLSVTIFLAEQPCSRISFLIVQAYARPNLLHHLFSFYSSQPIPLKNISTLIAASPQTTDHPVNYLHLAPAQAPTLVVCASVRSTIRVRRCWTVEHLLQCRVIVAAKLD